MRIHQRQWCVRQDRDCPATWHAGCRVECLHIQHRRWLDTTACRARNDPRWAKPPARRRQRVGDLSGDPPLSIHIAREDGGFRGCQSAVLFAKDRRFRTQAPGGAALRHSRGPPRAPTVPPRYSSQTTGLRVRDHTSSTTSRLCAELPHRCRHRSGHLGDCRTCCTPRMPRLSPTGLWERTCLCHLRGSAKLRPEDGPCRCRIVD